MAGQEHWMQLRKKNKKNKKFLSLDSSYKRLIEQKESVRTGHHGHTVAKLTFTDYLSKLITTGHY